MWYFVFFFQAEDGIRDKLVTGVQTCALPISFDFNGDGRLDLFVTDMHSDMWVNIPPGDWAAEARKADTLPAPVDFFPTGKSRFIFGNALFANQGDGRFAEVSDSVGVETYWPWGPSVDDLNADGWDDIFITAGMR